MILPKHCLIFINPYNLCDNKNFLYMMIENFIINFEFFYTI